MYIKLLGANGYGFPPDCTIGKIYEVNLYDFETFYDDAGNKNLSYLGDKGEWQVVDKDGNEL